MYFKRVYKHFMEAAQFRVRRHMFYQSVRKVTGKMLHCGVRLSNVVGTSSRPLMAKMIESRKVVPV